MINRIFRECRDAIASSIEDAKYQGDNAAVANISYNDGYIEVYVAENGDNYAVVYHDRNNHDSPCLEKGIEAALPNWEDIEIEEVITELGVDPGFRDYQDYLVYKFG